MIWASGFVKLWQHLQAWKMQSRAGSLLPAVGPLLAGIAAVASCTGFVFVHGLRWGWGRGQRREVGSTVVHVIAARSSRQFGVVVHLLGGMNASEVERKSLTTWNHGSRAVD